MSLPELDTSLFFLINRDLQSSILDVAMPFITNNSKVIFLPLCLWVILDRRKAAVLPLAAAVLAVVFADAGGFLLKGLIGRIRPCNALQGVRLLAGCTASYSMPSSHAINAFAFAGAFWSPRQARYRYLFILVAAAIGLSRVYVGVHYPFDVVAGAVLGLACAYVSLSVCRTAVQMYERKDYRNELLLLLALASLFRVYYLISGPLDLSPDEAHYWEWSRRPDWSYYSKGPMIAWLIYAGTAVFGNTVFGVRSLAVLMLALSSLLMYRLGRDLYGARTGFVSAALIQVVPLYAAFGVINTIDAPFIFFWVLSLYLFHKATAGHPGAGPSPDYYWIMLGLAVGMGLLSKYTMAFIYPCGLLFLVADRDSRRHLRSRGPYLAFLLSVAVFSPVIFWNAAHHWVTVRHTAGQANLAKGLQFSAGYFFEFLGSQAGIVTPLLFIMIFTALWRLRHGREGRFLSWFSVPVVVFFILKSMQGKVQANWALTGYAAGFIAFAQYYAGSEVRARRNLAAAAVFLAIAVTAVSHYPGILHLPQRLNPAARLAVWRELGDEASRVAEEMSARGPLFVFSDSYQIASEMAFYMKGHPVTYCVNIGRRMNQYDLWPGFEGLIGRNAILVMYGDPGIPESIAAAFGSCEKTVIDLRGRQGIVMKFTIAKCYDFRGIEKRPAETY